MKKILFPLLVLVLCETALSAKAQKSQIDDDYTSIDSIIEIELPTLDTIYYNRNGKGTKHASFASYYRVIPNHNDPEFEQIFRDFYPTGELKKEGGYLSIDKTDDSKTIFDGECISYYKNGVVCEGANYVNGKLDGAYETFSENGYMKSHATYKEGIYDGIYEEYFNDGNLRVHIPYNNGKYNGIVYEFNQQGSECKETEFESGNPKNDYYFLVNQLGYRSKLSIANDSVIWETPQPEDIQTVYSNGERWDYIEKNGLQIALHVYPIKDHGNYFRADIAIANNSLVPFEFDINNIYAVCTTKEGNQRIDVMGADEFMKHVQSCHAWSNFSAALGAAVQVASAGYSTSTTNTNIEVSGNSYSSGIGAAVGSRGWAVGAYAGNSKYSGRGTVTSTTKSYNGAGAVLAANAASQNMKEQKNQQAEERRVIDEGYAKRTTIGVGEAFGGYFHIKFKKKTDNLLIMYKVHDITYSYNFSKEVLNAPKR